MNLSGPLLLLLLTVACTVSGEGMLRAFWQFGNMIHCVSGVNPLKYKNYGCYCGIGGEGIPVDEVDHCCKVHDDCYGACMKNPDCVDPMFIMYNYNCSVDEVTCSGKNGKIQAAVCECDRAAALCFARAKYIPEHKKLNQKLCKK